MTKVKIAKSIGGHKAGDTIDVPEATAERFIARGIAEKPKAATKPAAKADDK